MEEFYAFMDSAGGFWSLIAATFVAGIAWMVGSKKLIDWMVEWMSTRRK